jgi:hypothetical protein
MTIAPTLLFEFQGGSEAEVAAQAQETEQICREFGGGGFQWAADAAERRRMWHARHGAMEATRALRPGAAALTTDVCVPISALAACVVATQADIADSKLVASIVGHVGDGNFHVILVFDPDRPCRRPPDGTPGTLSGAWPSNLPTVPAGRPPDGTPGTLNGTGPFRVPGVGARARGRRSRRRSGAG